MLGHLLPVLLTSLMHPNLQTLILADALMPQLVQLVLYTSQVSVLTSPKDNSCIRLVFFHVLFLIKVSISTICFPDCPVIKDSVSSFH